MRTPGSLPSRGHHPVKETAIDRARRTWIKQAAVWFAKARRFFKDPLGIKTAFTQQLSLRSLHEQVLGQTCLSN